MAIVVREATINVALDNRFKAVGRTYTLFLRGLSEVVLDSSTVTFNSASARAIDLASPVIFAIATGEKVVSLQLKDDLSKIYFTETLSPQPEYDDNGTYTVNDITITFGV